MKYRSLRIVSRVLFFCALLACFHAAPVHASVGLTITEVMYDPAGTDDKREWVEVYNSGTDDIDMTGHYILTDGVGSSKHSLVAQGSKIIPAGGYAVIVQDPAGFRADYPAYAGLMFDSSWTGLTATTGKTIVIIDSQSNALDQFTYDPTIGGGNTGDSLQKNASGAWLAALPSPGVATPADAASVVVPDTSDDASDDTASDTTGSDAATSTAPSGGLAVAATTTAPVKKPAPPSMRVELPVPLHAVAGVPVTISDKVYGYTDELRADGVSHFALGDGSSVDGPALDSFAHTYQYPGTYVVTYAYRSNPYVPLPQISARATIDVAAPSVALSSVASDGSLELSNTGAREADVSGWIIAQPGAAFGSEAFHIPEGTMIMPGKKISIAPAVIGVSQAKMQALSLFLPSGTPAEASPAQTPTIQTPEPKAVLSSAVVSQKMKIEPEPSFVTSVAPAAAVLSGTLVSTKKHSVWPIAVGLLGMVALGIVGYLRFRTPKQPADASPENDASVVEMPEESAPAEIRILEE